jgi:hypothetical protein
MILAIKNAIPKSDTAEVADSGGVADRIVRRSLAKR